VTHLGILATTSVRSELCFLDFREHGFAGIGPPDHRT